MRTGRKLVVPTVLVLASASAAANPAPARPKDEVELGELKASFVVLHDGRGHYLAGPRLRELDNTFYGDGKTFYQLRVRGFGSDEGAGTSDRSFWAANTPGAWASLAMAPGDRWTITCGKRETPLVALDETETRRVLDRAVFKKPFWKRQAYALARDDKGVYYYVDRLRDETPSGEQPEPPVGLRLFVGRKGRLKLQRLKDLDQDSSGFVLHARKGALSIGFEQKSAVWTRGKKRVQLVYLPVEDNVLQIYRDFGLYGKLGTPCDAM